MTSAGAEVERGDRLLLAIAAAALGFAAADNYVVVLALPDMMGSAGLSAEDLQQAAPIISGFLLGYIAMMPLIGRVADIRGRLPVLVGSLVVFALGSLVTATAYDLTTVVAGRLMQGIGAGGLLPATLALVADIYPPRRRGVPLGVVGAVQEFGNVAGPVFGAVVLAVASWRAIFWINLVVALLLAAVLRRTGRPGGSSTGPGPVRRRRTDWWGVGLAGATLACLVLVMTQPPRLVEGVTTGLAFLPVLGDSRWTAPVALVGAGLGVLLLVHSSTASRPLLDLRGWRRTLSRIDVSSALLLAVALAGVILAFGTADPQVQVFSAAGPWFLAVSAVAAVVFWRRNRSVPNPLVPPRAVAAVPAWGALAVSVFMGAALIAALVDVPVFARVTVYNDSQLMAALVLVRFLVGLPVGAFVGGWLTHRLNAGVVAALGMVLAAAGFVWMSRWSFHALESPWATVPLLAAGIGSGLAMPPVNAALLSATEPPVHGLASALLIVARTVGKLVGISALTTIGLRRYYTAQHGLPAPMDVCGAGDSRCAEYSRLLQDAGLVQMHTIFLGAALSCLAAGVLALLVFRHADTREVSASALSAGVG